MLTTSRQVLKKLHVQRYVSLYASENIFSEENVKTAIAKFTTIKPIRMQTHQPPKKAAVLIPLCEVNNKVSLLYTLRAAHLKSHRGQVSFPGGMQDITDKSLEETALRETHEELGISTNNIEIWCSGHFIITKGETSVLPVMGRITKKITPEKLKINTHEVEEVFTVPLEDLCHPTKIGHTQFKGTYSVPVFLGGQRRIWGLTAMITNMCLSSLLPQKAYCHCITYIPTVKTNKVTQ